MHSMDGHLLTISIVAAMGENGVIGNTSNTENFCLPWGKIPKDMRRFKELTTNKPIIMGRKTFETLGQKPLPDRTNIVLTQKTREAIGGAIVAHSIEDALRLAHEDALTRGVYEVGVIGGRTIYEAFLPLADRLYITYLDKAFQGDIFFPSELNDYIMKGLFELDNMNILSPETANLPYSLSFQTWERVRTH